MVSRGKYAGARHQTQQSETKYYVLQPTLPLPPISFEHDEKPIKLFNLLPSPLSAAMCNEPVVLKLRLPAASSTPARTRVATSCPPLYHLLLIQHVVCMMCCAGKHRLAVQHWQGKWVDGYPSRSPLALPLSLPAFLPLKSTYTPCAILSFKAQIKSSPIQAFKKRMWFLGNSCRCSFCDWI